MISIYRRSGNACKKYEDNSNFQYNKKTKGPTLMELFTATGKPKTFFLTTRDV
jgi:hypothetical protein